MTTSGQANANPYQFTGRENDSPLPLYYYRNRYYSPTFSRFTTQDPIDFAGGDANLYRYATNQPTDLSDPVGLINFVTGGGGSVVISSGGEASGGIFFNPGFFGQRAAFGTFGTVGTGGGFNVSLDRFFGVIFGGPENVSGSTTDINFVLGPYSLTLLTDPSTGELLGVTLGAGPGIPIGFSETSDVTGTIEFDELESLLQGPTCH